MLPLKPPQRVAARCGWTAKIELCPRFSSCISDCRFRLLTAQSSWIRVLWGWPIVSCRKPIDWVNWCTENRSLLWFNCRERIRRIEALLRFVESRFRCSIVLDSGRVGVQSARYWMNWAQKTYLCCVIEDRPTIDPWIDQSYWIWTRSLIDLKAFLGSMRWVVVLLPSFVWDGLFSLVLPTISTVFVRLERVLAAQKAQIDWKRVLLCI